MKNLTNAELAYVSGGAKNNNSLFFAFTGGVIGMTITYFCITPKYRIPAAHMAFFLGAFIGGAGADIYYAIQSFND